MSGIKSAIGNVTGHSIPIVLCLVFCACTEQPPAKHLFILSGQSNMVGLDPNDSFTPALQATFGRENVYVVKDAKSGEPIRRWYSAWMPGSDVDTTTNVAIDIETRGDLYDRLMVKVNDAMKEEQFQTVTFVWMQGERDAREKHGDVYAESLVGLFGQLKTDLKRDDVFFVLGRLSDFDLDNARYPHWTMVRAAQVNVAAECARCAWVDTDDLNDGLNKAGKQINDDLHYSVKGYRILGERFAAEAVALIESHG